MRTRILGKLQVGAVGLGCMGMSEFYGPFDDEASLKVLARALEIGVTLLDTSDMYGHGHNEELIGRFFRESGCRDRIVLASKFGMRRKVGEYARWIDNSPEWIRQACEASLRRLGIDRIDLYYIHRIEKARPIEETMGVLADLVREGKIGAIGISEPSAATLERAHRVHPVSAVQSEFSLWSRDPQRDGVLETCRRLGIGFVAYSPLGRGFLTGRVGGRSALPKGDVRQMLPRFGGELAEANRARLELLEEIAAAKGCTPGQLAIAWVMAQGEFIVPIPGTKKITYLEENCAAAELELTQEDLRRIAAAFPVDADYGPRYTEEGMKGIGE